MFPVWPGFEELRLRVEVQWQGQTRPVVARVERWPDSNQAVLVCAFEDDKEDGEWVITNRNRELLVIGHTHALLQESVAKRDGAPTKRLDSLRYCIRRAFDEVGSRIMRVIYLADLPLEPRVVLCESWLCSWHRRWKINDGVSFELAQDKHLFSQAELQEILMKDWTAPHSDARFAWNWMRWSDRQKQQQLCGALGDGEETNKVMQWVLLSCQLDWNDSWTWQLVPYSDEFTFVLINHSYGPMGLDDSLNLWHDFLIDYFAPHLHRDWIVEHRCTRDFWEQKQLAIGRATVIGHPTAHEQLEAKLQLRDWLQDKATRDQITALLDSLN